MCQRYGHFFKISWENLFSATILAERMILQFIDTFILRFLNLLHSLVNISYMSLYVHISRPVLFMVQC